MAVLARRNWAQLLTELTLRLGNITSSGFDARLQYVLAGAYFDICTTYHHAELDAVTASPITLTIAESSVPLPTDLFVLVSASIEGVQLPVVDFRQLIEELRSAGAAGVPTKCARYGGRLYFNKVAAASYASVLVFYYRRGLAPDFSGSPTSPELDSDVDKHIMELALSTAWQALGRPDLAATEQQKYDAWASMQVRVSLIDPLVAQQEKGLAGTTYTKGQG